MPHLERGRPQSAQRSSCQPAASLTSFGIQPCHDGIIVPLSACVLQRLALSRFVREAISGRYTVGSRDEPAGSPHMWRDVMWRDAALERAMLEWQGAVLKPAWALKILCNREHGMVAKMRAGHRARLALLAAAASAAVAPRPQGVRAAHECVGAGRQRE